MTEIKSISVSPLFSQLAKDNHISWSEAARIGMSMMLGDLGLAEYDNDINILRKMRAFQKQAEELSIKIAEMEKKFGSDNETLNKQT